MSLRSYDLWKRLMDVLISIVGLVVTAPLQLVIAACVRVGLGRPVLFRQDRPGRHERTFTLVKFRTMLPVDEALGRVTDEQRMTRLGALLRSTSLDELPTLWNVLRGDMSLVGPRPLLVQYLDRYSPSEARRHELRPGITGLAQVHGRNAISWEQKLALDIEYLERRSLRLDVGILMRTAVGVLRRDGITSAGCATMAEFQGDTRTEPDV